MSKLLLIGPSPSRAGGVATYLRHLTSALAACAPDQWTAFSTDKSGPRVATGRIVDGLRVARRLRQTLHSTSHCLAHICCGSDASAWGLREGLLHARMSRQAGLRVLLHLHASALPELLAPTRAESRLLLAALGGVDAIAVPAISSADLLVERGIPTERVSVVPNSVPLHPWQPQNPATDAPLRLLMVGTVEERKGFGVLLDALELLKGQQSPPLIVDAYGPYATSPDTLAAWERRGAELGLRFHGPCPPDAIQTHLLASDGLLLPSYAECQPFVLLEAMAASKPVMASQVGGVDRLLRGGAGKVIPPGEAGALAEALLRWLQHPEERRTLARGGWERVRDEHSITKGMEATLSAWKNAVGADLWETRFGESELENLAPSSLTNQT